jgi:ABC-2 type transport system permease protein
MTFLVPILIIGMSVLAALIVSKQNEFGDVKKVEVVDESGAFINTLSNSNTLQFSFTTDGYAKAKSGFLKSGYDYLLYIPPSMTGVLLFSEKKASALTLQAIENRLSKIAQTQRMIASGIDTALLTKAQKPVSVDAKQISEEGEADAQTAAAYIVGFASAFLIYLSIFLYGVQVMRGVIEEKVSRIIEVIISSVKPFQLMMGKIIGIGMVGLTQFLLWIILSLVLSTFAGAAFLKSGGIKTEQVAQIQSGPEAAAAQSAANEGLGMVLQSLSSIPVGYTIGCFLFYFLLGYLLYSSIFAMIGSAVDNETETQQFMFPVTLPLIFTFILSMNFVIHNPDSALSVWLSMIPFTSPIAMMIRIPFGVPGWQLALSMLLMILGFLFTAWVAARIYRVGILMYGKKASYKELAKWFMYKE